MLHLSTIVLTGAGEVSSMSFSGLTSSRICLKKNIYIYNNNCWTLVLRMHGEHKRQDLYS